MTKHIKVLTAITALIISFLLGLATGDKPPPITNITRVIVMTPKTMVMTATAYTNRVRETNSDNNRTAICEKPIAGYTVAVSQDLISWLGGRVYIKGIGVRRVNDLMNERFTKSIDIFIGSVKAARIFGKKTVDVVYLGI